MARNLSVVSPQFLRNVLKRNCYLSIAGDGTSMGQQRRDKRVKILHASVNPQGNAMYRRERIPTATLFDTTKCCDGKSRFQQTLPPLQQFEDYVNRLGIRNSNHVVIYDPYPATMGFYAAPRVWWMFKVFGHDAVSVLDGGMRHWDQLRFPIDLQEIESEIPAQRSSSRKGFVASFRPNLVKKYEEIVQNLSEEKFQVLDARSPETFSGDSYQAFGALYADEKAYQAPWLALAHRVPRSRNLYFRSLIDAETQRLRPRNQLLQLFQDVGVNFVHENSPPLTVYCGNGISACVVALAAHLCGKTDTSVYDGGWEEWSLGTEQPC